MKAALNKIHSLREMCLSRGTTPWIEVDGGVSAKNAPELIKAGALVAFLRRLRALVLSVGRCDAITLCDQESRPRFQNRGPGLDRVPS
eukprot:6210970-Pleurochrysis_carterae.AAC.4